MGKERGGRGQKEVAEEDLRKELGLATGSTWPGKTPEVECCGKKLRLRVKVMSRQMTSPHPGGLGSFR